MDNSTPQKGNQKQPSKPSKLAPKSPTKRTPLVDLDEKIARVSDAPTAKVGKRYFIRTTYIKGYGVVAVGEALTSEMAEAWKANTKVSIDAYVGKKNETLKELPKTDKEKLAAYEAQNKD